MSGSAMAAYAINALIVALVLGVVSWRMRRMLRAQRMTLGRLWILPAILALVTVAAVVQAPPHGLAWLWLVPAAVLGAVAGWYRGRAIRITVDPATGLLTSQGSLVAMILLVALIAMRVALKPYLIAHAQAQHVDIGVITDAFLFFALAMFGVQRLEMTLRARRLLDGSPVADR